MSKLPPEKPDSASVNRYTHLRRRSILSSGTEGKSDKKSGQTMMGAGIAIGVGVGLAIGNAMNNVGAGLAIGLAIGIAVGSGMQRKNKSEKDES
jgi:hypothetical protein